MSSKIFVEHALHVAWIPFSSPEPVVSLSSVSPVALGTRILVYSFEPRLMTIGLSIHRSTHSKKHFDHRAKTRLTGPEVRAAATWKAWNDSGRASFSPSRSKETKRRHCSQGAIFRPNGTTPPYSIIKAVCSGCQRGWSRARGRGGVRVRVIDPGPSPGPDHAIYWQPYVL